MYSRIVTINTTGNTRTVIGGVGENKAGNQRGYDVPPRPGFLCFSSVSNDPRITTCRVDVYGISLNPVEGVDLPGKVVIELPATVVIFGPPGLEILISAWKVGPAGERGAARTFTGVGPHPVPQWARTIDITSSVTFLDILGATIATLGQPGVGYTIPGRAVTMTMANAADVTSVRQG